MRPSLRLVTITAAPVFAALAALAAVAPRPMLAQAPARPASPFDKLHFRDIGPAVTSGRIQDMALHPTNPSVLFVATAGGGIWKSENKGTTWKDVFGTMPDAAFGAIAIFERDPKIVWAGAGEQNNRQSSSWGSGVYRSTDGGETWTHVGLKNTRSIGRILLDRADPVSRRLLDAAVVHLVPNMNPDGSRRGHLRSDQNVTFASPGYARYGAGIRVNF